MNETPQTEPEQNTADGGRAEPLVSRRPCETRFPVSECPNMRPVPGDLDMEAEHYACAVCGRKEKLWYDEMR